MIHSRSVIHRADAAIRSLSLGSTATDDTQQDQTDVCSTTGRTSYQFVHTEYLTELCGRALEVFRGGLGALIELRRAESGGIRTQKPAKPPAKYGMPQGAPVARLEAGNGHEGSSIEPYDDRTIDGESSASERSSARRGKQAILNECEDLEFFTKLLPIPFVDGILRPCV